MKFDERSQSKIILNPPFFVSMAIAAKFVQPIPIFLAFLKSPFFFSMATASKFVLPIPIFLAYHVPLDVDVVPIKFHQFLFGE
jgi:hypothetical protein